MDDEKNPQWEYIHVDGLFLNQGHANHLGEEGWEMTIACGNEIWFKRRIIAKKPEQWEPEQWEGG